jgi:uncharacterized protein
MLAPIRRDWPDAMAERSIVIVMAKAPRLGQGKSRLARDAGAVHAWRINRFLHRATFQAVRGAGADCLLAIAPDRDVRVHLPGVWPAAIKRVRQGSGDLGARLARLFRKRGHKPLAVIGTDCPDADHRRLRQALNGARRVKFLIGLTADGGFWFFAARHAAQAAPAFADVAWSTPQAARDLICALPVCAQLPFVLRDIDDAADWRAYRAAKFARLSLD